MGSLLDRLIDDDGEARLRSGGQPLVAGLLERLENGDPPGALGLDAADVLAALAFAGLGGPEGDGPPLVQRRPPRPRLGSALGEPALAVLLPHASRADRLALSSGLLQVHDFWDQSHEAAQEAEDRGERRFSAYWHGIGHRREPDAGNASYWFHRVGRHPVMTALAEAARPILASSGESRWPEKLLAQGWNPFAMIDLCAAARAGTPLESLARRLQRLEMLLLLDATAAVLSGA